MNRWRCSFLVRDWMVAPSYRGSKCVNKSSPVRKSELTASACCLHPSERPPAVPLKQLTRCPQIHLHPSFLLLPLSSCTSTEGFCPFLQGLELSQVLKKAEASSPRSGRASERSTMPTRARYGCFWLPDLEQGRSSQNLFSS